VRILLLEDDHETAIALEKGLVHQGHTVALAGDVETAMRLLDGGTFEAAVLDVMVPGGSGYDVVSRLRAAPHPPRILMLTARGSVQDRVEGLDLGADDYLVKPFSFAELAARLRALERRGQSERTELCAGELRLDLTRRVATVAGRRIDLTHTEFGLLACLLRAEGRAVSRRELLREIWGYEFDPGTNVVDVHVNRLRRKLEDAGVSTLVRTLRGQGYAAG
jgi:two-component system OmpR family response regulator